MIHSFFPHIIDSSMLSHLRSCPMKFFREYVQHWKPKGPSIHLHAGAAYASGLEAARRAYYEQGMSVEASEAVGLVELRRSYGDFECPPSVNKTIEYMVGAMQYYFSRYPLDNDPATPATLPGGSLGIEFSFAEPLPIAHPVTGDPLIFSGRSDMIVNFASGLYILDDKTSSQLGPQWNKQWDMRGQFSGYCWAARQPGLELPVSGVLVRGLGILKSEYKTDQALTYRSPWEIQRWYDQTCWDIEDAITMFRSDRWRYNLDEACNAFGGCLFKSPCKSQNPDSWLSNDFEQRVWDPLAREELPILEYEAQWAHNHEVNPNAN